MSGRPSWARVGAKVVCVNAQWIGRSPLIEGAIYTIIGFHNNRAVKGVEWVGLFAPDEHALVLAEAANPATDVRGFNRNRFRPLISLEHDMAVHFSALLDVPTPHEVDA
jgi:hypothetical protein